MESKDLLSLCRQAGIDVKNQLSTLDPDQRDAVELMVKRGGGTAVAAPPKAATGVLPSAQTGKIRVLDTRRTPPRSPEPGKPATPAAPTQGQELPAVKEPTPSVPSAAPETAPP